MYTEFFGLTERPFALTPNPRYVFYSQAYRDAGEQLRYGIEHRESFMLVTGKPGTGKTTLCRELLERLDRSRFNTALMFNPFLNGVEMLQTLLTEFGEQYGEQASRRELLDQLNAFLLRELAAGRYSLAIFDEAQHLSTEFLEQIRVLSNLETADEKLIQIVLVGQPELLDRIQAPAMAQLDQRVSVRCRLTDLNREQMERYVYHRLHVAGAQGHIEFSPQALRRIHEASGGVPRLVNLLCDRTLLAGFVDQTRAITHLQVEKAVASLQGEERNELPTHVATSAGSRRRRMPYAMAAAAVAAIAAGVWAYGVPALRTARAGGTSADSTLALACAAYAEVRDLSPATEGARRRLESLAALCAPQGTAVVARAPADPMMARAAALPVSDTTASDTTRLADTTGMTAPPSAADGPVRGSAPAPARGVSTASRAGTPVASAAATTAVPPSTQQYADAIRGQAASVALQGAPVVAPRAAGVPGAFHIQLGAFDAREEAVSLQRRLAHGGYRSEIMTDGELHIVRLGKWPTADAAEVALRRLLASGVAGFVVQSVTR